MSLFLLDIERRAFGSLKRVSNDILWVMHRECKAEVMACHPDAREAAAKRNGLLAVTDQLRANGEIQEAA